MTVLLLSLAGGLGAVARFVVDGVLRERWRGLPYGTLVVNVVGSLVLGVVTGLVLAGSADPQVRAVVGTGFCGGLTTFSTASLETLRLLQARRATAALLVGGGNLVLSLLAAGLGLGLAGRP